MLIRRAWKAFRAGGAARLGEGFIRFVRRRYYRLGARLRHVSGEVHVADLPRELIAGCM